MEEKYKEIQEEKYKKFKEKIQKILAYYFIFVRDECFFLDRQYSKMAVRYVIPAIKVEIPNTYETVYIPITSSEEMKEIEMEKEKRRREGEIEREYTSLEIKILEDMADKIKKIKNEMKKEGIRMFVAVENFKFTDFERCRYGYSFVISKKRLSQL